MTVFAMKTQNKLEVVVVPIDSLHPNPRNPRKWDEKMIGDLKQSIKRFGFTEPLIVSSNKKRKGRIISGHFRWTIAKELGISQVPVLFIDLPSEKQEEELLLRMNANQGSWNNDLLRAFQIDQLLEVGFSDVDLSGIWDDALQTEEDEFDVEREIKKIKTPKSKTGDLYALGEHRIMVGDALDPAVIKRLTGKEKIAMVYNDPVYNINLTYDKGVGGKANYGGTVNDKRSPKEYREFLKKSLENGLAVSKDDVHVFVWNDESQIGLVQNVLEELGLRNRRVCLWIKNGQNPTPDVAFSKAYEAAIYATRGRPYISPSFTNLNEILNRELGTGNQLIDDIFDTWNIWLAKRVPGQSYEHATQKPVTLHEKAIKRCTKPGDAVLDSFAGSGSTLIACEQMKRRCFTVDKEPLFVDLTIRRYEKATGKKARKLN